jgi:hypothetical protein
MLEAALVTVDLDTRGRDLALSDGHQQRHRTAISKCEHGTCPAGDELQLYGSDRREGTPLVIGKGTLFGTTTFRYRPPQGRLRWLLSRPTPGARHVLPFYPDGVHGIQVAAHVQVECAEGVRLILWGQKK